MATTFGAIYLGTIGTQIDPTEGNFTAENASALVDHTFGASSSPLYKSVFNVTSVDRGGNMDEGRVVLDQDNQASSDYMRVDLDRNGSEEIYTFDAAAAYKVTVRFSDGTTRTATVAIAQTTDGRLFLLPSSTPSQNDVLHSKPISTITVNSARLSAALRMSMARPGSVPLPTARPASFASPTDWSRESRGATRSTLPISAIRRATGSTIPTISVTPAE